MKHSQARNVIERCFGLLKGRWATLRSKSFYFVKTQYRIRNACCLLHNFIRQEMPIDQMDFKAVEENVTRSQEEEANVIITYVETSDAWAAFTNNLANDMFQQ